VELLAVAIERALPVLAGERYVRIEVKARVQSIGHTIEQDDRYPDRNQSGVFGIGLRDFENLWHPPRVSVRAHFCTHSLA
jgi:hypothetical protein